MIFKIWAIIQQIIAHESNGTCTLIGSKWYLNFEDNLVFVL